MPDDDPTDKKSTQEADSTVQGHEPKIIVTDVELISPESEESKEVEASEEPSPSDTITDFWNTTIKELRTLWRNRHRKRRVSGYNLYLSKCLPEKDSDVSVPKHMKACNLSWAELVDTEKAIYQDMANKENEES